MENQAFDINIESFGSNVNKNNLRKYYLQYSFGPRIPHDVLTLEHGIWTTRFDEVVGCFKDTLDNIDFREAQPLLTTFLINVPFKLKKEQYDFLKEHADLSKLQACVEVKKRLQPFYGRVFGIIELYKTLFKFRLTDRLPIGLCFAAHLYLLDMFELFAERNFENVLTSDDLNEITIKSVMKSLYKQGITDSNSILSALHRLVVELVKIQTEDIKHNQVFGTSAIQSLSWLCPTALYAAKNETCWKESGVSPTLQLIKDENNMIRYFFTDYTEAKELTFENLEKEVEGFINLNAYYSLMQRGVQNTMSFDEIMQELLIGRSDN